MAPSIGFWRTFKWPSNGSHGFWARVFVVAVACHSYLCAWGQTEEPKVQIESVLRDLISGIGSDSRVSSQMIADDSRGPAFYTRGKISVHEGLEDILGPELGLDALCFVLAHELAHHEREHICSNFVKKAGANTIWAEERTSQAQRLSNSRADETEADIYAGLYGHIAGFSPLSVASATLDRIYEAYDIPDSLPGYPSLEERKILAAQAEAQLDDIVKTYDAAWVALATGETAAASRLLNIIIHEADYTSPSLFGLLALVQFMDAIQLINHPKLSIWSWPLEMSKDPSAKTRGMSNEQLDLCFEILSDAAKNAARANQLNEGRSAREFAESGRVETGLEASIAWLTQWLLSRDNPKASKELMQWVGVESKNGGWSKSIERNLTSLTLWMDEDVKKALKLLKPSSDPTDGLNLMAIQERRGGVRYLPLDACPILEDIQRESIPRFTFGSGPQKESVVVAGRQALTISHPEDGLSDLVVGRGREKLNFILMDPKRVVDLCWGVQVGTQFQECVNLFSGQRKFTINLDLGRLLCLPDENLAFQFNSRGELSFVAISLN